MKNLILVLLVIFSISTEAQTSKLDSLKYDFAFKKNAELYAPSIDWRLLKAQCYQESRFDENAVSPVGARGICQFMPGTWEDETERAGVTGHPFNYKLNIQMASQYMGRLIRMWSSPRPQEDRVSLAMASFNAGAGNILESQKICGDQNLYNEIMICLPCVTGHHSRETNEYVYRIWNFYDRILNDG